MANLNDYAKSLCEYVGLVTAKIMDVKNTPDEDKAGIVSRLGVLSVVRDVSWVCSVVWLRCFPHSLDRLWNLFLIDLILFEMRWACLGSYLSVV